MMTKTSKLGRGLLYAACAFGLLFVLSLSNAPLASADPGWLEDYGYRMKITINPDNVASDLDNFPVMVYLDSTYADFWGHCDVENNIAFTLSDETTKLKREIELFDHTNDDLYAHVKVPDLSSTVDTDIYIYYDSAAHGQTNDADIWDDNFVMVQHMADTTTSTISDSTANNNDGTKTSANNPIEADGKIAKAQDFSSDGVTVASSSDFNFGTGGFSISIWVRFDTVQQCWMTCASAADTLALFYYPPDTTFRVMLPGGTQITFTFEPSADTWYHIVVTRSGTELKLYINGSPIGTPGTSSQDIPTSGVILGMRAGGTGYLDGKLDEVRYSDTARGGNWILTVFNNQSDPSTFYSVGAEETPGAPPPPSDVTVISISVDNLLLDNCADTAEAVVVTTTRLAITVGDNMGRDCLTCENVDIWVRDGSDVVWVDNENSTSYANVGDNENRRIFYFHLDTTDNDLNLGQFDVRVIATDNYGELDTKGYTGIGANVFTVSDITVTRTVDNIAGHQIKVSGTATRDYGATSLDSCYIVDNSLGILTPSFNAAGAYDLTYSPTNDNQIYVWALDNVLDGVSSTLEYYWPNLKPGLVSVSVSDALIDNDIDYAGSGADTDTVITVRIEDNDGSSDLIDAWVAVRDVLDALVENENCWSSRTVVNENQYDVTFTYDAAENDLLSNQMGAWDVWTYIADNWTDAAGWQTTKFTVDDITSTINFNPASPYVGWDLNVSGTHSRVSGAGISVDASWLFDNKHGQFALGASNTYDNTYTIAYAGVSENVSVILRVRDSPLDGETMSSYKTSSDVKFEVWVRFEENFENVPWVPDANRPLDLLFEWDGGTYPYTLTGNPENIVVTAGGIGTKIVKITDNDAYWRYVIPAFPGGALTFVIVDDPTDVEQFRFFLQDYTTQYVPPDGQLLIKSWVGTNLVEINSDFWGADWRTTAWLITGMQYQIWVRGVDAPLRLVGPIDAVVPSEEKTIIVQVIVSELAVIHSNVSWAAWRASDGIIRVEYKDNLDNTIEAHVCIYDMANNLVEEFQPDNEWFILTWLSANAGESYFVTLDVQHGVYGTFSLNVPIELFSAPPGVGGGGVTEAFGMPISFAALVSVILIVCVGLLFDAPRASLAAISMALVAAFLWYMGWFPVPGGWYTIVLMLIVAVLFALAWARRK